MLVEVTPVPLIPMRIPPFELSNNLNPYLLSHASGPHTINLLTLQIQISVENAISPPQPAHLESPPISLDLGGCEQDFVEDAAADSVLVFLGEE